MNRILAFATAAVVVLLMGCSTRSISEREAIPVPVGLTLEKVEGAVRTALQRARWQHQWKRGDWRLESSEPGRIVAGMQWDVYYLQLGIRFTEESVKTEILGSRNLNQEKGRIHRLAIGQQKRVEQEIAEQLGYLVAPLPPGYPADSIVNW
ncbi:MAG TPA: hypothetical protein VM240_01870 [Verrucomicrobiae bacterium]|nr:hypothetical protein [Verrucomicrobiae bacterium]